MIHAVIVGVVLREAPREGAVRRFQIKGYRVDTAVRPGQIGGEGEWALFVSDIAQEIQPVTPLEPGVLVACQVTEEGGVLRLVSATKPETARA